MGSKKRILLTNDDGYSAVGILSLARAFSKEYDVTIVAPKEEQSGKGHSFTYLEGITYREVIDAKFPTYWVDGTPSDCVKVAFSYLLDELPHYVLSGINSGENLGIASFYSGTVAAAREAAFWKVPALAFSLNYKTCDDYMEEYGEKALELFQKLEAEKLLEAPLRHFYNVNFPDAAPDEVLGVKVTEQSLAYYNDRYTVKIDVDGSEKLFVNGKMVDVERDEKFDIFASYRRYITISPLSIDTTRRDLLETLKFLEKKEL